MASTLANVVAGVQDLVLTVSGIRLAPDTLPNTVQVFPAVLVYPSSGAVTTNAAGFATELHTITVDLLTEASDWTRAYTQGTGLIDLLLRKIEANPTLSNTVQTYGGLSYTFAGELELSGIKALRWSIQITGVKIINTW